MQINRDRLVSEFLELVQIDSGTGQEREIADALKAKLVKLGLEVREDEAGAAIGGNAGNIIARLPGSIEAPTVLFAAHMDRVTPGTGIKPQIEDGIIRSDGSTILAADDVAGLAAILEGLRVIKEQEMPHGDIEILFTIAEEGGLFGAKNLDPAQLKADYGYFFDSGTPVGTIIVSAPAQKKLDIVVHGKAAHAGIEPEKGVNAIVVASRAINEVQWGRLDAETTSNIGIFTAGKATNIVTEKATLQGEVRSRNEDKLTAQVEKIAAAFQEAAAEFGARVEIDIQDSYPALMHREDDPIVQLAVKAGKSIGLEPKVHSTGGGSDASIINGYGLPAVVLGTGFQGAHSTGESIAITELERAAHYVTALVVKAPEVD